ncbi:MAG TPA: hypothetical protein VD887_05225 [Allosphingosinicella sp.]|nr:hypothetical protein [Allosphingosinicella sp.]
MNLNILPAHVVGLFCSWLEAEVGAPKRASKIAMKLLLMNLKSEWVAPEADRFSLSEADRESRVFSDSLLYLSSQIFLRARGAS